MQTISKFRIIFLGCLLLPGLSRGQDSAKVVYASAKSYLKKSPWKYPLLILPERVSPEKGGSSDKKNLVGTGFFALPDIANVNSIVANFEYERFLNQHSSLAVRVNYVGYTYKKNSSYYSESEEGTGAGVGFSYKHYFGSKPYGGFFLGPGIELIVMGWDYTYYDDGGYEYSEGTALAVCPNLVTGYRFLVGPSFSITPSVMLGYRVGISVESTGDATAESGPLGGVGVAFGFRF